MLRYVVAADPVNRLDQSIPDADPRRISVGGLRPGVKTMADGPSTRDLAGKFAFRFSGFAMKYNILYNLVGVGTFTIDEQGNLDGGHRSTLTALQGQKAKLERGEYRLNGKISLKDGVGSAKIHFINEDTDGDNVDGEFYVVAAGSAGQLWLVSSRDEIPPKHGSGSGTRADELVSLEAIRMADD